jgi:hypothetical protein
LAISNIRLRSSSVGATRPVAISHSGQLRLPGMPFRLRPSGNGVTSRPHKWRAGDAGWPCVGWHRWLPSSVGVEQHALDVGIGPGEDRARKRAGRRVHREDGAEFGIVVCRRYQLGLIAGNANHADRGQVFIRAASTAIPSPLRTNSEDISRCAVGLKQKIIRRRLMPAGLIDGSCCAEQMCDCSVGGVS